MLIRYFISSILLNILLTSCDNNSANKTSRHANEKQTGITPTKDMVDTNFNAFIEKFSSDSAFQFSRTKFPLIVKWYDIDNDSDSLIYMNETSFQRVDFREKEDKDHIEEWKQRTVMGKNNTSATIEIRGIENGIMVDYLFEKINEVWMLIEIDDSST